MKNVLILILLAVALPWPAAAQKNKIVSIEATGEVPYTEDKSEKELRQEALQQAILNGLQEEFGMVTYQGDKLSTGNYSGSEVKTTENFSSYAGTQVKGDLIKTEQCKCKEVIVPPSVTGREMPEKVYRCTVKFTARKASESKPDFEAYPIWRLEKKAQTFSFENEDPFYLYFKSPSSGFLSVYLDDSKTCQRLLPSKNMGPEFEDGVPVTGDKEYYLFSRDKQFNYFGKENAMEAYVMSTEYPQETNQLIIIFSKNPVAKPPLKDGAGKEYPKEMTTKEFETWRIKKQSLTKDMAVSTILITISKPEKE